MPRWLIWIMYAGGMLVSRLLPGPNLSWTTTVLILAASGVTLAIHWAWNRDWSRRPLYGCDCEECR